MDGGEVRFIVPSLQNPPLLERNGRGQDKLSHPYQILSLEYGLVTLGEYGLVTLRENVPVFMYPPRAGGSQFAIGIALQITPTLVFACLST